MTVQLVQSIKEAESKAEAIHRAALQKARQAIKDAEERAALLIRDALTTAEKEAKGLLKQAEEEARAEAEPLASALRDDIAHLEAKAQVRLPKAVAVISERIVKFHAHN